MQTTSVERGQWGSRLAFVLAAAGSAIGLGNIWRFPYMAAENGGGAFVLVYLFFVVVICLPVLYAELAMGRETQRNPVGAFRSLAPGSRWHWVGGLGVLTGFGILAFYSVVAGWTLAYLFKAVTGTFSGTVSAEASARLFRDLIGDPLTAIGLTGLFLVLTVLVVRGGVSAGIGRTTKVLMPLLLLILLILAARSLSLPGGWEGVVYLFSPDFSKLTVRVIMSALGQALFSLSLGMGAMITYGSYLTKKEDIVSAGAFVAASDTMIALLAGLIIFPALFSAGVPPDSGPGLVFVVLPTIFGTLPAGSLFAVAFYVLLAIAALTSTISLLEVVVSYLVDQRGWSRGRSAWLVGLTCFMIAIPSALSQGGSAFFTTFLGKGMDFLSVQSILWGNYSLSLGAVLVSVFAGWIWGWKRMRASITAGGHRLPAGAAVGFLVRWVCPIAIALILLFIVVTRTYF